MKLIFVDKENEDFIFNGDFWLRKIRCFFFKKYFLFIECKGFKGDDNLPVFWP